MNTPTDAPMDIYPVKVEDLERFWGNEMGTPMDISVDTDASKLQNF